MRQSLATCSIESSGRLDILYNVYLYHVLQFTYGVYCTVYV
jgi:hypothetical protein